MKFMRGLGVEEAVHQEAAHEPERPSPEFWHATDEEMLEVISQCVRDHLRHAEQFRMHPAMKDLKHHQAGPGHPRISEKHPGQLLSPVGRKSSKEEKSKKGKKAEKGPDLEDLLMRWERFEPQSELSQQDADAGPPQTGMAGLVLENATATKV